MESSTSRPDWTQLPPDLLTTIFGELEIPDLLRSVDVCRSWHSAYSAFRRLRLPSPKQSPCLLYSSDASGPDAAALYCPATGATFRVLTPEARIRSLWPIGSADGWLVAADEIGSLHLLNPLSGGRVDLPPVTAMYHVEASLDEEGGLVYDVDENNPRFPEPTRVLALEIRDCMYYRAVLSCSPSAGAACVVLLVHMPDGELSYTRPGDERWTRVSPGDGTGLQWRSRYCNAVYSKEDSLFYVVRLDESVQTLDLNGPSPVARTILRGRNFMTEVPHRYLVPSPWGDLLHIWRNRMEVDSSDYLPSTDDEEEPEPKKLESLASLGDHALFLGYNTSLCLPVKDILGLKPNRAYITDDFLEYVSYYTKNKPEVGVWNITSQSMEGFRDATHAEDPWLNWPAPI
ncbi:hypothetical protein BRADI_4g14722v3 [Brachypodium distachyon]|uniref:F-box domain-containing protein n=1 Tax=Brachypodium distachyon TaxID=15368 RepID=A0A0Q3H3H7_BRADI|nr:hypothetical protein BRADI_4g14722v3 [Brachypodium distachyon]